VAYFSGARFTATGVLSLLYLSSQSGTVPCVLEVAGNTRPPRHLRDKASGVIEY
jgi:hypothetical protein